MVKYCTHLHIFCNTWYITHPYNSKLFGQFCTTSYCVVVYKPHMVNDGLVADQNQKRNHCALLFDQSNSIFGQFCTTSYCAVVVHKPNGVYRRTHTTVNDGLVADQNQRRNHYALIFDQSNSIFSQFCTTSYCAVVAHQPNGVYQSTHTTVNDGLVADRNQKRNHFARFFDQSKSIILRCLNRRWKW